MFHEVDSQANHCFGESPRLDHLRIQIRPGVLALYPHACLWDCCCAEMEMEDLGRIRASRVSIDRTRVSDYHLYGSKYLFSHCHSRRIRTM